MHQRGPLGVCSTPGKERHLLSHQRCGRTVFGACVTVPACAPVLSGRALAGRRGGRGGGGCISPARWGMPSGEGDPCAEPHGGCSLRAWGRQMAATASAPPPCLLTAIAACGHECHICSWIVPEPSWFPARAARVNPGRRRKFETVAMRELGQEQPGPAPASPLSWAGNRVTVSLACELAGQPRRESPGEL